MDVQKNGYYSNKKMNSPIFNYYSNMINQSNLQDNSGFFKISENNLSQILNLPIIQNNNQNNTINKINESKKKDSKKKLNNKIIESNEIKGNKISIKDNIENKSKENDINNNINNIKLSENSNLLNTKENTIKIKSITPEDLIPTKIKDRVILRINPLVYKNESYEFLSSNLYILLKDQIGCKYLQEKLETDTIKAVYYFYPALLPNLLFLIKDSFANYFIQRICSYLNEEQIEIMLYILKPEIFQICSDTYGSRSIQCIMNYLLTLKLKMLFFDMIRPFFISLINDINGVHIIYNLVNEFPEFMNEINIIINDNCINLALNKRGSFFIQNYLMLVNNDYKNNIIDKLIKNCSIIIVDKFGNYIIQFLFSLREESITTKIITIILDNIIFYSKHNYSNYVIEKLFFYVNSEDKNKIIKQLSRPEIMRDLIFDKFGNFIILKALIFADNENKNIMLNMIKNLESKIKEYPHGKTFLNKVYSYIHNVKSNNNNNYENIE